MAPDGVTNRTSLYLLIAALVIAALTNRWMARGPSPAFNIVSFDSWLFTAQWIAFGLALGAMLLLAIEWHERARFPWLMLVGGALLAFFVATGIPQTQSAHEWKSGEVGVTRWLRLLTERGEANEIAPQMLGTWKSAARTYVIERDRLTVTGTDGTEILSAEHCASGFDFRFAYATDGLLHSNPAAYAYYAWIDVGRMPSLEVVCGRRLYTFLRSADGTLVAFRDVHEQNPRIETLAR